MQNEAYCPVIAIVLPNYNGAQYLAACLASLNEMRTPKVSVILVDNASTDLSVEVFSSWQDKIDIESHPAIIGTFLVRRENNDGFASACNAGMEFALQRTCCSAIWLLNVDTVVDKDALSTMIDAMASARTDIVGCTIADIDQPDRLQSFGGYFNFLTAAGRELGRGDLLAAAMQGPEIAVDYEGVPISYVVGASMLIDAQFYERCGGMSESLFLYYEELEWIVRSKCTFCVARRALIWHKGGGLSGGAKSPVSVYFMTVSRILFLSRHNAWSAGVAIVRSIALSIRFAITGRKMLSKLVMYAIQDAISGTASIEKFARRSRSIE
jgi:GT2 family glycosyltransferase